mmetsp:Transcript_10007/g.36563  ORF Transcript_10007/g.36563 Transcript_10007/m.36563 type:complete len:519 (-) Transcript_10007:76-1632(-)
MARAAVLGVRQEPFEFGVCFLSLVPRVVEDFSSLTTIKAKLYAQAEESGCISADGVAKALGFSKVHAQVLLHIVHGCSPGHVQGEGVHLFNVLLFVFLQLYVKSTHHLHHNSNEIWPNATAHRMPAPRQETADTQQLTFMRECLPRLLALVLNSREDSPSSPVSAEELDRLQFLITTMSQGMSVSKMYSEHLYRGSNFSSQNGEGSGGSAEPSNAPGGTDSQPPHTLVLGTVDTVSAWLMEALCQPMSELDKLGTSQGIAMPTIEHLSKCTLLRMSEELPSEKLKISECQDVLVYALAPLQLLSIVGCTDCTFVVGAVGQVAKIEKCERVQVIVVCKHIQISNCHDCTFYMACENRPLLLGDNRTLHVAPYNTNYSSLREHLAHCNLQLAENKWNQPIDLFPQDDVETEHDEATACHMTILQPEHFVPFIIPFDGDQHGVSSQANPFELPPEYQSALESKIQSVASLRKKVKEANLDEDTKKELQNVIQSHFKDWLLSSGNMRQVFDLARIERDRLDL